MAHVGSVVPQEVASASSLARQRGEQICYASSTRHGQLRIELLQRLEGERALVQAGMRHGQAGLVEDDVPVEEEVEVDRPGAPALVAHATEPALDVEQHAEERPRLERRLDRDGAVDECRLSDASPGPRLPARRAPAATATRRPAAAAPGAGWATRPQGSVARSDDAETTSIPGSAPRRPTACSIVPSRSAGFAPRPMYARTPDPITTS